MGIFAVSETEPDGISYNRIPEKQIIDLGESAETGNVVAAFGTSADLYKGFDAGKRVCPVRKVENDQIDTQGHTVRNNRCQYKGFQRGFVQYKGSNDY